MNGNKTYFEELLEQRDQLRAELAAITGHLVRMKLIAIVDDGKPDDVAKALAEFPDDFGVLITANAMELEDLRNQSASAADTKAQDSADAWYNRTRETE